MKLSQNKNLLAFDQDRTLSQITARIEAIKAFNPPKAIIVDYLQRYDPQQEKGETRDMAIGRMTMALKDLAVSLKIPVILLAQLGREVEKENRIPRLSDLRECISVKDSLIFTSQGVWYNSTSPMSTISLNREGNIESCDSRNAKREDAPEMLKITLQSGRFITCTPNHAIRTDRGWLKASQIIDESIACVRKIPAPRNSENFSFAKWIGWMLGNGCMTGLGGPSFICSCEDVAKSFCETNKSLWGFEPKPHRHWCKSVYQYDINNSTVRTPEGNPVKNWLKQHDLWGYKAHEKTIPQWFCETADNDSLANLVAGLWETDGSVILKPRPQLSYSTTSPMLAWQVVWALNRLGVFANFEDGYMAEKANYLCYKVSVRTKEEIANFKRVIRLIGRKGKRLDSITASDPSNTAGSRLSKTVGKAIEAFRLQQGFTHKQMGYRYQGKRISQRDLQRVNENIRKLGYRCAKFDELTNADIFWDKIRRIEKVAGGPVFDRVVPEHHNFVANGIVVHNSGNIEQDADRVIFIHAPDENQDGSKQDLTDQTLQRIEVQIVQAKGRSDGVASIGMSFHRPTTTFWGMSR
jgi:replicative DNA helicase